MQNNQPCKSEDIESVKICMFDKVEWTLYKVIFIFELRKNLKSFLMKLYRRNA